jgi:hypothetical protein
VRRYRIRQDVDRRVAVEIAAETSFDPRVLDQLTQAYRSVLGDLPIAVRLVDALPPEPGRKFETVISEAARANEARSG